MCIMILMFSLFYSSGKKELGGHTVSSLHISNILAPFWMILQCFRKLLTSGDVEGATVAMGLPSSISWLSVSCSMEEKILCKWQGKTSLIQLVDRILYNTLGVVISVQINSEEALPASTVDSWPFKPQYPHTNSPNWSPYNSFKN